MSDSKANTRLGLGTIVGCALLMSTADISAEPKGQDAGVQLVLRKAQGVVRQLTQDKAALEAEKAAWLQEKAGLEARVKSLEANAAKAEALEGELAKSREDAQRAREAADGQIAQSRQREQTLLQKHRDVVTKAKAIRDDNQLLVNAVQEREKWISDCGERNKNLIQVNQDVVKKYQNKSLWDEFTQLDSITGIGSVKAEQDAEDYRYKIQHMKTLPVEVPPAESGKSSEPRPAEDEDEEETP